MKRQRGALVACGAGGNKSEYLTAIGGEVGAAEAAVSGCGDGGTYILRSVGAGQHNPGLDASGLTAHSSYNDSFNFHPH